MNAIAKMPKTAKQRGKVAPKKLAHMVLRTKEGRVETILDWYKKVLEGEAMYENPMIGFVTYDQEHHRVAVLALPGVGDHVDMTCGLHHVAFTYDNLHDLMHTYNRLKDEHGITPEFCINHGPTTSMYYFDPDKNQIELQVDNVPEEKFAEYFDNGEFTENPIGIKFDPDEMTAKLAAGVPEAELLKRPAGTPPDLREFPVN
jgi:catechol 2,3-dioxygenase-like lactoylglutathione lyase family enzyme